MIETYVERLYTIPEAARRLGVSDRTLRGVLKTQGIGLVRLAGGWPRVRERDLVRLTEGPSIEPDTAGASGRPGTPGAGTAV